MTRLALTVALAVVLVLAVAAPAFGVPANDGLGKMYGEHISDEAKAGTLGPDVHPGMHRGFRGWPMAQ